MGAILDLALSKPSHKLATPLTAIANSTVVTVMQVNVNIDNIGIVGIVRILCVGVRKRLLEQSISSRKDAKFRYEGGAR
jgi:hypothetical protein